MPTLTLARAESLIDRALQAATTDGVPSVVVAVDAGGHVLALKRQDGAPLVAVGSAIAKARTAVSFKTPTAQLVGADQPGGPLFGLLSTSEQPLVFIAGGVPVTAEDGSVIGAIAAAGGSPDQDAQIVAGA